MYDIVVIGGGPAGVTAALRARELGASVALVERNHLGGTCTNDGCVPTRVLAHAARLVREAGQFAEHGLTFATPQVDFAALMAQVQTIVYEIHEKKQLIHHLQDAGVTVLTEVGAARFVDAHHIQLADGTQLEGDRFIICAGGHARQLDFPGSELALTHHDIWQLTRLPRSLIIVGASATGCQLASVFNAFGTQVTLVEVSPRILRLEDELVSQAMTTAFEKRGIRVITGIQGLEKVEKLADGLRLTYRQGETTPTLEGEAIVIAVGWPGNAEQLNLGAVNVENERGYIKVNDYLQSSAPNIFAAGDITGRMMLVQSASYEARVAAENAVLGVGQPNRHLIVPHGGFTDPEYASVGLTEEKVRQTGHEFRVAVAYYKDMDRAVIDRHTEGFCKLIVSEEDHRILGAHIVGEQALEIVQLVAAGMASDIMVEQLADLEIAYPTYTAIVGLAARNMVRDLGILPLAPAWRTLGRQLVAEWEGGRQHEQN